MAKKISEFRTELMGIAILWVLWFHTQMKFENDFIHLLKTLGYGGVDIFFLVSGLGIYKSLEKDGDVLAFYKRRIIKIMPAYIPILIVWMILQMINEMPENLLGFFIGNITGLALWARNSPHFNWYIQALLLFYGLAPIIKKLLDQYEKKGLWFALSLSFSIAPIFWFNNILMAVSRFPIFVIGMYLGKCITKDKKKSIKQEIILYGVMLIGVCVVALCILKFPLLLSDYGMWWYPFVLIIPGLCMLLVRMLEKAKYVRLGVRIIGTVSLEIYLVHIVAFDYLNSFEMGNLMWLIICIIMLGAGIMYHTLITKMFNLTKKLLTR